MNPRELLSLNDEKPSEDDEDDKREVCEHHGVGRETEKHGAIDADCVVKVVGEDSRIE